jgi:2-polyprenyl-3-methyl-5-hydroxy-6-metoxy-1,4-benzoquinol methylase
MLDSRHTYVGVEISDRILAWLTATYPQLTFYKRDLEGDELSTPGTFDTILIVAVLEHLKNPTSILTQVPNYLKPRGKVVITTPTPLGGFVHTLGTPLGLFYPEAAGEHEKFYTRDDLQTITRTSGLQVVSYSTFLFGLNQLLICQAETPDNNR